MIKIIFSIFVNANRSLFTDINGKKIKFAYQSVINLIIIPFISLSIVYKNHTTIIEDSKIISTLLSLFSGLMFGVLLKIPDKFKDITQKNNETIQEEYIRKQLKNYLKLFMYSLSYCILVALFSIFFVLIGGLFPSLLKEDISLLFANNHFNFDIRLLIIAFYRFLLIYFLFSFMFFILKAVANLYELTIYEFNKLNK